MIKKIIDGCVDELLKILEQHHIKIDKDSFLYERIRFIIDTYMYKLYFLITEEEIK